MVTAERTMRNSGWLDDCIDGCPDVGSLEPIQPYVTQPAKLWKAAILATKKKIIEDKLRYLPTFNKTRINTKYNNVEVVDKSYIDQMFTPALKHDKYNIENTIKTFNLNKEQERAFRIISNHATMQDIDADKLHIYLGGMGGTGKSQVIKALIHFFTMRNKSHEFLVVAPTASAATLLNGSTYHSIFGINQINSTSAKSLAQIRANLEGVEYIFLDEVSML